MLLYFGSGETTPFKPEIREQIGFQEFVMIRELQRIFKDFQAGRNIEIYVLTLLAIVIAVLDIFNVVNQLIANAVILSVLAALLYGRILDRRQFENQIHGIREFHENRETVPSLQETLSGAKRELLLIGVALTSVVHSQRALLENLARKGCKIKIAVWKPPSDNQQRALLIEKLEDVIDVPDLERNLPGNIERLRHWYSSLDESARKNIEIRGYTAFPSLSIIFVDKDNPEGLVHVEPIIYRAPPEELPSFRLGPHDAPKLFQILGRRYTLLWENSESLVE